MMGSWGNLNPEIKIMKGSYGWIRVTFLQVAMCENFLKAKDSIAKILRIYR